MSKKSKVVEALNNITELQLPQIPLPDVDDILKGYTFEEWFLCELKHLAQEPTFDTGLIVAGRLQAWMPTTRQEKADLICCLKVGRKHPVFKKIDMYLLSIKEEEILFLENLFITEADSLEDMVIEFRALDSNNRSEARSLLQIICDIREALDCKASAFTAMNRDKAREVLKVFDIEYSINEDIIRKYKLEPSPVLYNTAVGNPAAWWATWNLKKEEVEDREIMLQLL
jgi:hypothetical protein